MPTQEEYVAMAKKMADLEEKYDSLDAQVVVSREKEKVLDAALGCVDQLQLQLSETKKVKAKLFFSPCFLVLFRDCYYMCKLGAERDNDEATSDDGIRRQEKEKEEEGKKKNTLNYSTLFFLTKNYSTLKD